MADEHPRLRRERSTIRAMISIYCRDLHGGSAAGLCADCAALQGYALLRLDKCTFQQDKPTCVKCPVHCYKKDMREKVRVVMRYAGPKMLLRHPVLAVRHLIDGRRPAPAIPRKNKPVA